MMGLQDAASGLQRRLGSSSSLLWATPLGFNPATLFGPTDTGWVYDLSDMSTLFQDAAGITPVTAVNQPVGLCLDKSGRGNHRRETISLNRPTYARHPLGGIRNLLTFTEEFDNAAWTKGSFTGSISANTTETLDPLGGNTAEKFDATVASSFVSQAISVAAASYTYSFYAKAGTASSIRVNVFDTTDHRAVFSLTDGSLTSSFGISSSSAVSVGNGWWRLSISYTGGAAINSTRVFCPDIGVVYVWGAQLELGSTATPYQRVGSVFDVTEAGVPDLYYLSYDGLNDSLSTAPFAWGSDKATVVAGVRKLSDAAVGVLAELSVARGTNAGSFTFFAPTSAAEYQFRSRGSVDETVPVAASGFAAPITNVLTGLGDIAGDRSTIRVNGTQIAQGTSDQGTGNYGTYPAFFGARGGTDLFFKGREYSQFAINRLLTPNELSQIERYTAQRTGVTIP